MKRAWIILCFIGLSFSFSSCCSSIYERKGDELYVQVGEEELYCIHDPDYEDLFICENTTERDLIKNDATFDGNIFLEWMLKIATWIL
jgi:hypothetical protein